MTAGCGEDFDLSVIRPAPERVRVDAEHPARFTEGEPVLAPRRCRDGRGDAVNLREGTHGVTSCHGGARIVDGLARRRSLETSQAAALFAEADRALDRVILALITGHQA